nr:amino acid ABC transporter permease [Streptomyces sp. NBC_00886]
MTGGRRKSSDDGEPIVPVRRPLIWAATVVVLVFAAMLVHGLVTNKAFQWNVVGRYLFDSDILAGLGLTVLLTVITMVVGLVLGTVLALMRLSGSLLLSWVSWAYIWFFRSVPVLVQLIFWFNFGALYSHLSLGVPFGPELISGSTNTLITPMTAALAGLGLSQAAYTGEVIRAGILAVPKGQTKAALALGMSHRLTFQRIVLPQAMKIIIPPLGNEVISTTKGTSLVSVIALSELLYSAQLIYARTYETIPLLIVASLWYLAVVSVLSVGQHFLERRYRHA